MDEVNKFTEIDKFTEEKAISRGKMKMYKLEDAIEFIRLLEKGSIEIMGIDGFKLFGEKIQPFMEYSSNYSGKYGNWKESIEFINKIAEIDAEIIFEIVHTAY